MKTSNKILAVTGLIILLAILVITIAFRRIMDKSNQVIEEFDQLQSSPITKEYLLTDFNCVELSGLSRVTITQADQYQILAEGPERLINELQVEKKGNRLRLETRFERLKMAGLNTTIKMPAIEALEIYNISQLSLEEFDCDQLKIRIVGAGTITGIDNGIANLDLDCSGAAAVDLRDGSITNADLNISGASTIKLTMAGGKLSGNASGAGKIIYYGEVSEQDLKTSGAVQLKKR